MNSCLRTTLNPTSSNSFSPAMRNPVNVGATQKWTHFLIINKKVIINNDFLSYF